MSVEASQTATARETESSLTGRSEGFGSSGPGSRPIRVAWVAEIPVPYRVGLYRRMRSEAGIDLKLLFCAQEQADRDWTVALEGVPHVMLPGTTFSVRPREQFYLRVNPQIWPELSHFQPDAVIVGGYAHVTMQLAMVWCRRTRTPYLINSESHCLSGADEGSPWGDGKNNSARHRSVAAASRRWATTSLKRFFIRGAAAGLPAGTPARRYLIEHGGPEARMFMLPNSAPAARFARESSEARLDRDGLRRQLGLDPVAQVILFVGRLVPAKGLDLLLRAFQAIDAEDRRPESDRRLIEGEPPATARPTLLLVGSGEQRAELEALAWTLNIADRVRFAGSRPWEALPALYAAADLFVLPSRFEPWGAVVHEAMSCGLPVIVSDQVGCAVDLVRPGENGWIVPAGSVADQAGAMRAALSRPERLIAMGAVSARIAAAWGEEAGMEALTQAINAVIPRELLGD